MPTISLPVVDDPGPRMTQNAETTVGNYFVANYPPFGFWSPDRVGAYHEALQRLPRPDTRMGVYAHIPFCRKRCHFCYFRVYTDKNAKQIRRYLDAAIDELRILSGRPVVGGRLPKFVYFGGGTPSYLSADQLRYLTDAMKALLPWDEAEEITIEAEPGTLNEGKLSVMREIGITRLSLGIEHFDDRILEINGRAHRSKQVFAAYDYARSVGFPEINIDLIAGMLEETDAGWDDTVRRAIDLAPDTVTIYQMEVPYNTTIYQRMREQGQSTAPIVDWETKRRWVDRAFNAFERAGYAVTSATTVVKNPSKNRFVYRNGLFDGSDVLSVGVSAFGHVNGVNYQNEHDFDPYIDAVSDRGLPVYRAYGLADDERYIREFALQLKSGCVELARFAEKFGVDPRRQFASAFAMLSAQGFLRVDDSRAMLTREGLMQVDKLLFEFFRPEHRHGRFA